MANPTTNYGFVLPTATDLVTDLPADFDVALQGVDTRLKALQPGTTLGDLAYSSATANTNTRLGVGSAGQVLTVASGVPSWATASSSAMTLITRQTASGVAALTIDNCFTSTYKTYLIVAEKFYASGATDDLGFELRFGTTNKTGAYYGSSGQLPNNGGALVNSSSSAATFFKLQTDSASGAGNVTMYINQVGQGSGPYPAFNGTAFSITPTYSSSFFGGMCYASEAYHGIVFLSSSSNITIDVAIYGLAAA